MQQTYSIGCLHSPLRKFLLQLLLARQIKLIFPRMDVCVFGQVDFNQRLVLFLAQQDADGGAFGVGFDIAVKVVDVHLHLAQVLVSELADFQVDQHRGIGVRLQLNSRCGQQLRRCLRFLHSLAVLRAPFTLLFMCHDMPAHLEVGTHLHQVNATRHYAAGGQQQQRANAVLQRQFRIGCRRRRGMRFFHG